MKKSIGLAVLAAACVSTWAWAAPAAKTYQVTGPVLELTDAKIVVQAVKANEKWEIARTADTKVDGELKVGAKVTIEYRMVAADVTVKADGKADAKAAEAAK
jgi:hypothetical protein